MTSLYDFLSLKNDVNVPELRIGRIRMFSGLPDPYLDPLIRGTDPSIRILTDPQDWYKVAWSVRWPADTFNLI